MVSLNCKLTGSGLTDYNCFTWNLGSFIVLTNTPFPLRVKGAVFMLKIEKTHIGCSLSLESIQTEPFGRMELLDAKIRIPASRGCVEKAQVGLTVESPCLMVHSESLLRLLIFGKPKNAALQGSGGTLNNPKDILRLWDLNVEMVNFSCVFHDEGLNCLQSEIFCRLSLGRLHLLLQDNGIANSCQCKIDLEALYISNSGDNFDDIRKYLFGVRKHLAITKSHASVAEAGLACKNYHSFDFNIETLTACLDVDGEVTCLQLNISNPVLLLEPMELVMLLDRMHSVYRESILALSEIASNRRKNNEVVGGVRGRKFNSWKISGEIISFYHCFHFRIPLGEEGIHAYICSVPLVSISENYFSGSLSVYQISREDTETLLSIATMEYCLDPTFGLKLSNLVLEWTPDIHSCLESAISCVQNALNSSSFRYSEMHTKREFETTSLPLKLSHVQISTRFPDGPQTQVIIDEVSQQRFGVVELSKLSWKIQNHIVLFIAFSTLQFSFPDFLSVPLEIYCRRLIFCLPHDFHFGNNWMEFFWRMKGFLLRRKRYMSSLGNSTFPDMNISADDCSAIFEDNSWESFLMMFRPVMKDETFEQIKRRRVLRTILEQLPAALRSSYEKECYSKLNEENATLYAYRVREAQRYWQLDRFDLSGIEGRLPPLLLANLKNCSLTIRKTIMGNDSDVNTEMLNELHQLDECKSIPDLARIPSMYKDFGIRKIEFHSSQFSFHLRDYPHSVATARGLSFSGKVGAMEQATKEPFIRHMFVALGSKVLAELWKQITPLKVFVDGKLTVEDITGVFGVGMLPSFEDLSQCFLRLSPDRSDPSPRLAFWDLARLIFHGKVHAVVRRLNYNILASTCCYSQSSYYTVEADELNATFTRCMKDNLQPWLSLRMENFSLWPKYNNVNLGSLVKLNQVEINVFSTVTTENGRPDDHYLHPFAERNQVPFVYQLERVSSSEELVRKLKSSKSTCQLKHISNHDTYGGFRVSSLSMKVEIRLIETDCTQGNNIIHSDDIASTLQCIENIRHRFFQCIPVRKKFGYPMKPAPAGRLADIMKTFRLHLSSQGLYFHIVNDLNPGHSLSMSVSGINLSQSLKRESAEATIASKSVRLQVKNLDIRMRSPSLDEAAKREEEEPSRGSFFVHIPMLLVILENEADSCLRTSCRIVSMENLIRRSSSSLSDFSFGSDNYPFEDFHQVVFAREDSENDAENDIIEPEFNGENSESSEIPSRMQQHSHKKRGFTNQILAFDARILWTVERRDSLSEWPRAIFLKSHRKGAKTLDRIRRHQRTRSAELDQVSEGTGSICGEKEDLLSLLFNDDTPRSGESESSYSRKQKELEIIASFPQLQVSLIRPVVAFCSPETEGVCKLVASYGYLTLVHQQVKEDDFWKRLELQAGMEDTIVFTLPKGISFNLDSIRVIGDSSANLQVTNTPFERISGPPIFVEVVHTSPLSDEVDMDSFRPKTVAVKVPDLVLTPNSPQFFIFLTVITNFLVKPFQQTMRLQEELAILTHTIHLIKHGHLTHRDAKQYAKQIINMIDLIDRYRNCRNSEKAIKFFNHLGSQDIYETRRELIDKANALVAYALQKRQSESNQGWMPKFYLDVCINKCKLFLKTTEADETSFVKATIDRFQVKQISTLDGGTKIEYSVKDVKMKNIRTENATFKNALAVSKKQIGSSNKLQSTENVVFTMDGDPVAFRWFTIQSPPVGRIHVVDVLTVGIAPLEIALTRHISEELYQFFMRKSLNETEEEEERAEKNIAQASSQAVNKVSSFLKSEALVQEGSREFHTVTAKLRSVFRGVEDFTKDSGLSSFIQGKWINLRRNSPEIQRSRSHSDHTTLSQAKTEEEISKKVTLPNRFAPVDDLSCMRQREQNNILFKYVYLGQVSWTVSFKYKDSVEEKSILDFEQIRISLPSLMYHSHTWSWTDLLDQLRRGVQSRILGQALSRLARRKLLGVRELGQKLWRDARTPDAIRLLSQTFGRTEEELTKVVENLETSESDEETNEEGGIGSSESALRKPFSQGKLESPRGKLKNERDLEKKRQLFFQVIYGIDS